ncbi:MAG: hypothetical protein H6713_17555 [Myxococcales bacterium]|nr:hypothetical protein [Myxococcales bacterium]MCB9751783.1 hypothetical protein [Myxococcales bacterium]
MSQAKSPLRRLQGVIQDGQLAAAVRRREYGTALSTASVALETHGVAIQQLEDLVRIAGAVASHIDEHSKADLRRKLGELSSYGRALTGEVTTETLENSRRQLRRVRELVDDVSTPLQRGWERRVEAEFTTLAQLGKALEAMNAEVELGARMRNIARLGLNLGEQFPASVEALTTLTTCIEQRDEALGELSKPDSRIDEFLLKVANGVATLLDLDLPTLDWLHKKDAAGAFAVRVSISRGR